MSAELKPCPMCGGTAQAQMMDENHMVMCHDCGVNYEGPTAEDCAEAWNRRTVEAQADDVGELPPLPVSEHDYETYTDRGQVRSHDAYTADQMRDYARAALKGKP